LILCVRVIDRRKKVPPKIKVPLAVQPTKECLPARTSGWADFLRVLAAFGLISGTIGGAVAILGDGPSQIQGFTWCIVGIVSCVQVFFMAFLVDVFTEIRWYLARMCRDSMKEPNPETPEPPSVTAAADAPAAPAGGVAHL
jgi:hypothetical protein